MGKSVSDGLARLQNESRIPATTWRQWCTLLEMHPEDAIDVWEEICHPITIANRRVPEIPYILQLRCGRPELDIYEFKDECAKVLHLITFLFNLDDERLTKGKIKSALLKLYRGVGNRVSPSARQSAFIERYLADACALVIIAKVVKGDSITLSGVLKPVVDGKATLTQVGKLALKSLDDAPHARAVRQFLHDPFIDPDAGPLDDDEEAEDEDSGIDDDDLDEDDDIDDDEDDDDDEDEDDDEDDEAPIDLALVKFKNALHAIYEYEAGSIPAAGNDDDADDLMAADEDADGDDFADADDELLDQRLKVTAAFDPLRSAIPSMEEAQNIARRLENARNAGKNRPTLAAGRAPAPSVSAGGGGGGGGGGGLAAGGGGGGGGGVKVIKGGDAGGGDAAASAPSAAKPAPRKDGKAEDRVDMSKVGHVDVDPTDFVDVADVSFPEFSERVHQVCRQLATVEKLDQVVWSLFIEPTAAISDVQGMARTLDKEETDAFKAYGVIRMVAQFQGLKNLLAIPDKVLKKDRNFRLEVTQMLNTVNNSNRELQPEARQLAPLAKVLDHAAGTLVRLEALRVNTKMGETHAEQYTRETATVYFEEALRQVTDLTDRDMLAQVRARADADTVAMLGTFSAAQFVKDALARCREYVKAMVDEGGTESPAGVASYVESQPLTFGDTEANPEAGEIPADVLAPSDLGETFDTAAKYVCQRVWSMMAADHQPEKVIPEIIGMMRELMVSSFRFEPVRRRHQDNARLSLNVVSLDTLVGNSNLKDLYVRVSDDGQVHYVEDFEDGTYVDLFELREYKPQRLASAAKKKAEAEDTEMLQTGRKYLCTVGRTNKLFGTSPSEVINNCYREDGETKIFPAF